MTLRIQAVLGPEEILEVILMFPLFVQRITTIEQNGPLMQEYLEEDLGLSHLPVIVSAQHGLSNPLTGSPQVLLMGDRETITLRQDAFLPAGFIWSSVLPVLPPPSWRSFIPSFFLLDGNNLLIKCLY